MSITGKERVDVVYHWSQPMEVDHFAARISPGGTIIASALCASLVFWDTYTGKCLKEIHAHSDDVTRLCFSPDGHFVCTASDDNTLRLWKVPTIPKWSYVRSLPEIPSTSNEYSSKPSGFDSAKPGCSYTVQAAVHRSSYP